MTTLAESQPRQKILLLDDDPAVLDLYQQMLLQLPSAPEVHIASSGARAMAMLDSEAFNILVCDLNMPKMDGLQVIAIVRRKYPQLRTVIITGVADEQMRGRAYSMGIDLYLEKPSSEKEFGFFMDCVESLLDKEQTAGFRGVQSKTLVDLIQLECLSGSSSVLKITNGKIDAKIWIQHGEVIDAQTEDLAGQPAFERILGWKTGNFEIFPAEPGHARQIHTSYQGLLLGSAQAHDEAMSLTTSEELFLPAESESDTAFFQKSGFGRVRGVEFALKLPIKAEEPVQKWGLENADALAEWARASFADWQKLGEKYQFGDLQELDAKGLQARLRVLTQPEATVVIGMLPNVSRDEIEQSTNAVLERWAS